MSSCIGMTHQLSYYIVPLQAWCVYFPISSQIGLVITNHIREFCYSIN